MVIFDRSFQSIWRIRLQPIIFPIVHKTSTYSEKTNLLISCLHLTNIPETQGHSIFSNRKPENPYVWQAVFFLDKFVELLTIESCEYEVKKDFIEDLQTGQKHASSTF